ncbi:unnamed protein product [Protopolystoma xenopodis]|uniref:Uncharacterized protein n=1 Tax=Protopolystoma xenopodis TaxID=117903 RepID=A0A3S5CBA7_9PLAT|nr:unnamed protein product [Protopolystoma xenopodis]
MKEESSTRIHRGLQGGTPRIYSNKSTSTAPRQTPRLASSSEREATSTTLFASLPTQPEKVDKWIAWEAVAPNAATLSRRLLVKQEEKWVYESRNTKDSV